MGASGLITLLTDFGTDDAFVGIMKGVVLGIAPEARIVDLSHGVPPQEILRGALLLRSAVPYFPPDTIHVAVVDPGVGSAREPIVVVTERGCLVGPNNGLLHPAAAVAGIQAVHLIDVPTFARWPVSRTFHGRDVFAVVAGHLARGVAPEQCGPTLAGMAELPVPVPRVTASGIRGEVLHVDRFGNLVTNIEADSLAAFPPESLWVTLFDSPGAQIAQIRGCVGAYTAVPEGSLLAIIGSWGTLEIAARNGSAARTLSAGPGARVSVNSEAPNKWTD